MDADLAKTMKSKEKMPLLANFINQTESWFLGFMVDAKKEEVSIINSIPEGQFTEMFFFLKKNKSVLNFGTFNQVLFLRFKKTQE